MISLDGQLYSSCTSLFLFLRALLRSFSYTIALVPETSILEYTRLPLNERTLMTRAKRH
jgi:hypothetical protein